MNIPGLIEPILHLIPTPGAAGASSLAHGLSSKGEVEAIGQKLEGHVANGVTGLAGQAMLANVRDAMRSVQAIVAGGHRLDGIAHEAVAAVTATAGRITMIARECLAQVSTALHGGMLLNPAAATATLMPIAMAHWRRAEAEIEQLGMTLREFTGRIRSTHLPSPRAEATTGEAASSRAIGDSPVGSPKNQESALHAVSSDGHSAAPSGAASKAVSAAKSALGTPYQWGGNVPGQGLDCSGLTQWAYKQAGIDLPRTADAQAVGPQIPQNQVRPGDLAVWDGHVAMVVEGGKMIEAGDPVQINPIRQDNIGMAFKGFFRPTAA